VRFSIVTSCVRGSVVFWGSVAAVLLKKKRSFPWGGEGARLSFQEDPGPNVWVQNGLEKPHSRNDERSGHGTIVREESVRSG